MLSKDMFSFLSSDVLDSLTPESRTYNSIITF